MSTDPAALAGALEVLAERKPLLYGATTSNFDEAVRLAKDHKVPLAVRGKSLEELAELTAKAKQAGVEDLVLAPELGSTGNGLSLLTQLRRLALEKNFRPLGYPVLALTTSEDPVQESLQATVYVCKYASIVVMRGREAWQVLPVLTARFNIFTDPQVPNAVEAKLVKLGEPGPDAPVLVTTNFALTYFMVEGEVENSKTPTYIVVVETNGLGILNSYADDKLTGETIAKAVKATGVMDMVRHKRVVIPGLVSVLKGELEDELGCEVVVGPEESAGIPAFLKTEWRTLASA
jgi:acetyl-CoA decarbonylase/synthase complex subunit gamma